MATWIDAPPTLYQQPQTASFRRPQIDLVLDRPEVLIAAPPSMQSITATSARAHILDRQDQAIFYHTFLFTPSGPTPSSNVNRHPGRAGGPPLGVRTRELSTVAFFAPCQPLPVASHKRLLSCPLQARYDSTRHHPRHHWHFESAASASGTRPTAHPSAGPNAVRGQSRPACSTGPGFASRCSSRT